MRKIVAWALTTWPGLEQLARRGRSALLAGVQRCRERAIRITLGTRLLVVLVAVATASTVVTIALQDSSLRADLRTAAQARLERAREIAAQLLDEHLQRQQEKYRTIASTPQFLANVEARHVPTLSHFARELATQQRAAAILFLDPRGFEVAAHGNTLLGTLAAAKVRDEPPGHNHATLLSHGDRLYCMVGVPLGDGPESSGSLVSLEVLDPEKLSDWSRLCQAQLLIEPTGENAFLSLLVRSIDGLQIRVLTSFADEQVALANSRWNMLTGGLIGLALAFAASILLARSLVQPIRVIQHATERIGRGDLRFRLDATRGDEVGDVARAYNLMLDRLEQNIRVRVRVENQIHHLAFHDGLTGLGNRRLFHERLGAALEECRGNRSGVAVLSLDLDRFKDVNDTLGHTAADELLIKVARRLSSCVQTPEWTGFRTSSGVFLARLGGDEFTILVSGIEKRAQVEGLADGILHTLSDPFELRGGEVNLSACVGIALSLDDDRNAETLLRDSELAMFQAKTPGGRNYEFYADSMLEIAARKLALKSKLERALENGEFELYYQPKVDLGTGQLSGVEALLRWRSPEEGTINPSEFIPMAEETGAIIPIGEWALREAVEQAQEWQREGLPPIRIAVNVSVRQIEHRGDLVGYVADLLAETGFDPKLLDLEITEGALLRDEEAAIALLDRLRVMGVGLSLDDFGTGYSSLSYLRRLPVDTLKIDRSFIQGADSCAEDAALVASIVSMAKVLNLRVVAEGVETRKQRRFLEGLGCDEIQGFLFSEPLNAEETAAILRKQRPAKRKKKAARRTSRSR